MLSSENQKVGRVELMSVGTISTDSKSTLSKRIQVISKTMAMLIKETRPDLAVVERVIVNINPKTSLALGEARGAILSTLTMQNIDIVELTPMQCQTRGHRERACHKRYKLQRWCVKS